MVIFLSYDLMTANDRCRLRTLTRRLAASPSKLFLGYFGLNRAEFLGLCATVITYTIILMQFKQSGV